MKKVVVIGSGIIGMFSAYYLNKKGYEVVILDKKDRPSGASTGNAGMIVPSHFIPLAAPGVIAKGLKWMFKSKSPFSVHPSPGMDLFHWLWLFYKASKRDLSAPMQSLRNLGVESRKLYTQFHAEEQPPVGFKEKGLVMYTRSKKIFEEEIEIAHKADALGIKTEILNREQAQQLDPSLTLDVVGGVYYPGDAFLSPNSLVESLQNTLQSRGVRFLWNENIKEISIQRNKISHIVTKDKSIEADEFVLAAGNESAALGKMMGIHLPLQPGKGYSMTLANPIEMPQVCSILTEARVAVTPMKEGLRFAGTLELGANSLGINKNKVKGIIESIPSFFPKFREENFSTEPVWSGLRPCSPDGLPYIGRSKKLTNLTIGTGHAMMGVSLAPVTGEIISTIIDGKKHSISLELIHPDRYQ
ncbi:MAG: FAD-dependent oxidoreductase [Cyclobacteriaceae bacterium]|nr:FAD-dependent oxidoreductase [Cyclobacteriaceae bacterium]